MSNKSVREVDDEVFSEFGNVKQKGTDECIDVRPAPLFLQDFIREVFEKQKRRRGFELKVEINRNFFFS